MCDNTPTDVHEEEVAKKDDLIKKLSSMDISGVVPASATSSSSQSSHHHEIATLRSQMEQLTESKVQGECALAARDAEISLLKEDVKRLQESLVAAQASVKESTIAYQNETNEKDRAIGSELSLKQELTVLNLKVEKQNSIIDDLQRRLNYQTSNAEAQAADCLSATSKLRNFVRDLMSALDMPDKSEDCLSTDNLTELVLSVKNGKLDVLSQNSRVDMRDREIAEKDAEIARMQATNHRLLNTISQHSEADRNSSFSTRQLELALKRAEDAEKKIQTLENQLLDSLSNSNRVRKSHSCGPTDFIRELSDILNCASSESTIKQRVLALLNEKEDLSHIRHFLERQVAQLETQVSLSHNQCHHKDDMHSEKHHSELIVLQERFRTLQLDMSVILAANEQLATNAQEHLKFLSKLAGKLHIDASIVTSTDSHDELHELLLAKVSQARFVDPLDEQSFSDRIAGLSRRTHRLQDQLASRDVQMGLWREKCSRLQDELERAHGDEANIRDQLKAKTKEASKAQRLEVECSKLRSELDRLRTEMYDNANAMVELHEANERNATLTVKVSELDNLRVQQAGKIAELIAGLDMRTKEAADIRGHGQRAVDGLAEELRSLRRAHEKLRESERELIEFRNLIGRNLGMDIGSMAMPNFEIVRRLERLLTHHDVRRKHALSVSPNAQACPNSKLKPLATRITNSAGNGFPMAIEGSDCSQSAPSYHSNSRKLLARRRDTADEGRLRGCSSTSASPSPTRCDSRRY